MIQHGGNVAIPRVKAVIFMVAILYIRKYNISTIVLCVFLAVPNSQVSPSQPFAHRHVSGPIHLPPLWQVTSQIADGTKMVYTGG